MGSYGGALYLDSGGQTLPEISAHSGDILLTQGKDCKLRRPRPIPQANVWFETVWAEYRAARKGKC